MRSEVELRALLASVIQQFERAARGELERSLLKKVSVNLFEQQVNEFIKQRIGHLNLGDLYTFIKVIDERRGEEPSITTGTTEQPTGPKPRGRPRKVTAEGA